MKNSTQYKYYFDVKFTAVRLKLYQQKNVNFNSYSREARRVRVIRVTVRVPPSRRYSNRTFELMLKKLDLVL